MQHIVFTFVGNDQPGLVQRLSKTVSEHDGNWLESQLAQMAGKFAGIVSVRVPASRASQLSDALAALSDEGLSVTVEHSSQHPSVQRQQGLLAVLGNDRPGIVHEISSALAAHHINIEAFSSIVESAPMAGIPLFSASIRTSLPPGADLIALQEQLDDIANALDIDINLTLSDDGAAITEG